MKSAAGGSDRARLRVIAVDAMRSRGLEPEFPPAALAQAEQVRTPPTQSEEPLRDFRALLWCSIDNDESRDLDQLSVAEKTSEGIRVRVAIADVDAVAARASPIDRHAAINTTSVYTPAVIFPMLPERLSTDLTSLVDHDDRLAIVFEFVVSDSGDVGGETVYGGVVRNRAKLAYGSVGAWLEGGAAPPGPVAETSGMAAQLELQDRAAQALARVRHEHGALDFETIQTRPVFDGDALDDLEAERPNRARALIENLMIATNGVCARFLAARAFPSLRRVVRTPERWDRIVSLARDSGVNLPPQPDPRALAAFLAERKSDDPDTFVDLSQTVVKLLGPGEYVADVPGEESPGHFGLAVRDYTHSTAPNRRYPDLITQRLVKAALAGHAAPYSSEALEELAAHCTRQENAANKVERHVTKSAAALLMEGKIGARFDAIVTGASAKGTWVRIPSPPVEGRLVAGERGLDVGDHVRVRLQKADVERGFIDFVRA
jgi:exoribonuclease-2